MLKTKVEDMAEQHTEILGMAGAAARAEEEVPPSGLVAVASGYGLVKLFRSLGARIVSGGQTANPSVQDIVDAVRSVSAEKVIVLPNNKNVLMAAQKAAELLEGRAVIIPTRTLGQGIGAALGFQADQNADELAFAMEEAAKAVTTFEVTRASRATTLTTAAGKELTIADNDVIGLQDDELVQSGGSPEDAVLELLMQGHQGQEIVTVFGGPQKTQDDLDTLAGRIREAFPDCGSRNPCGRAGPLRLSGDAGIARGGASETGASIVRPRFRFLPSSAQAVQRRPHNFQPGLRVLAGQDQRRTDPDNALAAVEVEQAALKHRQAGRVAQLAVGAAIGLDKFDADKQSLAAHVAQEGKLGLHLPELGQKVPAHLGGVVHQRVAAAGVLDHAFQEVERGVGRRRRHRVAAEGRAVRAGNPGHHAFFGEHGAERQARGDPFGERHDVGLARPRPARQTAES